MRPTTVALVASTRGLERVPARGIRGFGAVFQNRQQTQPGRVGRPGCVKDRRHLEPHDAAQPHRSGD